MYAHQVIDDLRAAPSLYENYESLYGNINLCDLLGLIRSSHKFHIGFDEPIRTSVHIKDGTRLFSTHPEFLRLPFDVMWIDYQHEDSGKQLPTGVMRCPKRAMLIYKTFHKTYHLWVVHLFDYFITIKRWAMSPIVYVIDTNNWKIFPKSCGLKHDDPILRAAMEDTVNELSVLEATLLLLNCKNIGTEQWEPPTALNNKRRSSNKEGLFVYKTLTIALPGCKRNTIHANGAGQYHNKIHFCRGHFKSYTEENKLSGKLRGLWWWQPHVRGQNKEGVVMKDYSVQFRGSLEVEKRESLKAQS